MTRKMKTMDSNHAAAHASYVFTDVAVIFPIIPSSPMVEAADEWTTGRRTNILGREVQVTEVQSEVGVTGSVHSALAAGTLTATHAASQGLLLVIPNLYKIVSEQLLGVIQVSARALATYALFIFGDRPSVYVCRRTGCAILYKSSIQEVIDLTVIAHMAAIRGKVPFVNLPDGFHTSYEIQKTETWGYDELKDMVDMDAIDGLRKNALNSNHPYQRGPAQNPGILLQTGETCNPYHDVLPAIVQEYTDKVNARIDTNYKLFDYYGTPDAEHVIISMSSVNDTIKETIDYMVEQGQKVGVVKIRLYRPFCAQALIDTILDTVKATPVLDGAKEPSALGEPLYLDVVTVPKGIRSDQAKILTGRYGSGSKDTTPTQIVAVYEDATKSSFTVGIVDDVTNLSLELDVSLITTPEGTANCKFQGLGADGIAGASKNSIGIIGDNTDMYAQAYFDYDSKRSGGVTMPYLRFGHTPTKSTYLIHKADFAACHNPAYMCKYSMVQELVDDGTFLLNCPRDKEGPEEYLLDQVRKFIAGHNISFYTIDGAKISIRTGMEPTRISTILQSAFSELIGIIPAEEASELMKAAAKTTYGRKGEDAVTKNWTAIDAGAKDVYKAEAPESWKNCGDKGPDYTVVSHGRKDIADFINNIQSKVNAQEGNNLPASAFVDYSDDSTSSGSSAYEKRGVAAKIPIQVPESCVQCNFCSYVCLRAVTRPAAMVADEAVKASADIRVKNMTGMPDYKFAMTISPLDRTSCGSCANMCPGMKDNKALKMKSLEKNLGEAAAFDSGQSLPVREEVLTRLKENTVKGNQLKQPLLEFSDVCTGCGETPYAKLVTQLFGDRICIANATGCFSIWDNSSPSTPYTVSSRGQGPTWDSSLLKDSVEFGYGMLLAQNMTRNDLKTKAEEVMANEQTSDEAKVVCEEYLDTFDIGALNGSTSNKLVAALDGIDCPACKDVVKNKDFLAKKSQWVFGGDGRTHDTGFGDVDHVLTSGKDINIMVYDTEVYSSMGGQSSKAVKTGAVAQFAAGGKDTKRKDLAGITVSYDYVYVAQARVGADMAQTVKAIVEAETYPGPSLTIAYASCINHGIRRDVDKAQTEEKLVVECGYWNNFRYNPATGKEFSLDFKPPKIGNYQEFLKGGVHYLPLIMKNPEKAAELFARNEAETKERYAYLEKLVTLYGND